MKIFVRLAYGIVDPTNAHKNKFYIMGNDKFECYFVIFGKNLSALCFFQILQPLTS